MLQELRKKSDTLRRIWKPNNVTEKKVIPLADQNRDNARCSSCESISILWYSMELDVSSFAVAEQDWPSLLYAMAQSVVSPSSSDCFERIEFDIRTFELVESALQSVWDCLRTYLDAAAHWPSSLLELRRDSAYIVEGDLSRMRNESASRETYWKDGSVMQMVVWHWSAVEISHSVLDGDCVSRKDEFYFVINRDRNKWNLASSRHLIFTSAYRERESKQQKWNKTKS